MTTQQARKTSALIELGDPLAMALLLYHLFMSVAWCVGEGRGGVGSDRWNSRLYANVVPPARPNF